MIHQNLYGKNIITSIKMQKEIQTEFIRINPPFKIYTFFTQTTGLKFYLLVLNSLYLIFYWVLIH